MVVYFTKNLSTRGTTKQDPANIDPQNEAITGFFPFR